MVGTVQEQLAKEIESIAKRRLGENAEFSFEVNKPLAVSLAIPSILYIAYCRLIHESLLLQVFEIMNHNSGMMKE